MEAVPSSSVVQFRPEKHSEKEYARLFEERSCELLINYGHIAGNGDRQTREQLYGDRTRTGCEFGSGEEEVEVRVRQAELFKVHPNKKRHVTVFWSVAVITFKTNGSILICKNGINEP